MAAGLLALAALLCFPAALLGRYYYGADMTSQNVAWRAFAFHELRAGRLPLWSPELRWGYPLAAEPQVGTFYPGHWLVLPLPLSYSFGWTYALHFALAAAGLFWLLRALEVRRLAAAYGGLAFGLSGFFVAHVIHPNMVAAAAWLPWLLWAAERARQANRPRRWIAAGGLIFGLQLLAGHPEISLYSLVALAVYLLARRPARLRRAACTWVGAAVLGACLAAVQLGLTIELVRHGLRSAEAPAGLREGEFPLAGLLGLLAPNLYGNPGVSNFWAPWAAWETCGYVGVLTLLLAAGSVRAIRTDNRAAALGALAVVGLLLALGAHLPLGGLLIAAALIALAAAPDLSLASRPGKALAAAALGLGGIGIILLLAQAAGLPLPTLEVLWLVPPFSLFRNPGRFLLVAALGLSGLAALAVHRLLEEPRVAGAGSWLRSRALWIAGASLAIVGLILLALGSQWEQLALRGLMAGSRTTLENVARAMAVNFAGNRLPVPPETVAGEVAGAFRFSAAALTWTGLLLLAAAALMRRFRGRRLGVALIGLLIVDLFVLGLPYNPSAPPAIYALPRSVQALPAPRAGRVTITVVARETYARGLFSDGRIWPWAHRGWPDWPGVARFLETVPWNTGTLWRILSTDLSTPLDVAEARPLRRWVEDGGAVAERTAGVNARLTLAEGKVAPRPMPAMPRAYLAGRLAPVATFDDAFTGITANDFDPRRTVYVEAGADRLPAGLPLARPAQLRELTPTHLRIDAQVPAPTAVVVTDLFYPGWRARVDGRPAPVYRADAFFRAVPVPAGRHVVELYYLPRQLYPGMAISLATLVALLILMSGGRLSVSRRIAALRSGRRR
jgi:hypothetical protein